MAESKLVQLNFKNNSCSTVYVQYNVYVFSILSLDCILISDLVFANLFMHSLSGMILLYLTHLFYTKGVLHEIRIITFVKLTTTATNNILMVVAGTIPGKVPNTLQLNCLAILIKHTNSPTQRSIK